MTYNEADTRSKLIDPVIHIRGWTEDTIKREVTASAIEIINGKPRRKHQGRADYILRLIVQTIAPRVGETVYDPCCGTGGFLAQAYEFMRAMRGNDMTGGDEVTLKHSTFYGREKDNLIYPIALANLILHGIDEPHIWHGNTLTDEAAYEGLFSDAATTYDVILTNPPFGGKEGKEAQTRYTFQTGATQILFVQHILNSLKAGAVVSCWTSCSVPHQ